MKLTICDKIVFSGIFVALLMSLAVATLSLVAGEPMTVGLGNLEFVLTSPISVILTTSGISLSMAFLLWLFLKKREHAHLALALLLLMLAPLSLAVTVRDVLRSIEQSRVGSIDLTFFPLLLFGLLSLRAWSVGRRAAQPRALGPEDESRSCDKEGEEPDKEGHG